MSIAYGSGGRHRPVDVSADDGDEIAIDGTRLKQLRVGRGLSISEAARLVTLSREQVEQIENGGLGAFYGARHKLLAVRKYAEGLGIALEDILPAAPHASAPMPEPVPVVEQEPVAPVLDETTGDVAAIAGPVIAKATEKYIPQVAATDESSPAKNISDATVRRLPLAVVVAAALILVFSILRGLTSAPEVTELPSPEPVADTTAVEPSSLSPPAAQPEQAGETPASQTTEATASAAAPAPEATQPATDSCAVTAGPDTPRWAPAQARNASTRVFVTSAAPIDVCVTDATGTSTPLKLKPGAMSSVAGKPPYVVRSEKLSQAQIFLQGLKVRVPSSAVAVHLITTSSVRSPEPASASEQ